MKEKVFLSLVVALLLSAGTARAGLVRVDTDPRVAEIERQMINGEITTEAYIEALRGFDFSKAKTKATPIPASRADSEVRSFTAVLTEPGTLASVIGDRITEIDSLTVEGPVNREDFLTMWQCAAKGSLYALNLKDARPENNKIPDYALYNYRDQGADYKLDLNRVILPEGITEIGKYSFAFSQLQHINLPSSLRKFGICAFFACDLLGEEPIVIPEGVEEIPKRCFAYMHSRGRFELPSSLRSIGAAAFYDNRMTEIEFKEGLETVGESAFSGCNLLRSIKLPTSCTKLENFAFDGLLSAKEFIFSPYTQYLPVLVLSSAWELESITIPGSVRYIDQLAFYGCESLKQVTIENGVKYIYSNAFEGCPIETLTLPSSIQGIANDAFLNCKELKCIYSQSPVAPAASLPALPALETMEATTPTYIPTDGGPFAGCPMDIPVYVPIGSAESYRSTPGWDCFTNIIESVAGIDTPVADSLGATIAAEPGAVRLTPAAGGSVAFAIHSADGRQVTGGILSSEQRIELPAGIYIVTCGSQRTKIAIRP